MDVGQNKILHLVWISVALSTFCGYLTPIRSNTAATDRRTAMTPAPVTLPPPFLEAFLYGDVWHVVDLRHPAPISLPRAPWLH